MPAVTKVSSRISFAFAKPASMSPYDHSSTGSPVGSCPSAARAKSPADHFALFSCGGPVKRLSITLPSVRASGSARIEAHERVHAERQLFVVDLDEIDRVLRRLLVHRGDGENRLADEHRLVGQYRIARRRLRGHFVRSEDSEHAGQLERLARVDAPHASMRHRARQEPAEHHALGAKIFRVFRLAGDFAVDVGRDEILTQQVVCHDAAPFAKRSGTDSRATFCKRSVADRIGATPTGLLDKLAKKLL